MKHITRPIPDPPQRGFVLITILVLLSLIALVSVHTLQSTHLTVLLASHRTQEVRAHYQLDAAMLSAQSSALTRITQTCIPWPPMNPLSQPVWMTQWITKTSLGYLQQRTLFRQTEELSHC